ncbi:MAG: hypothetical protein COA43_02925 [Robiginitomaculum sp.]|nr:MAG: hypothetical protein COA43_02925 [Robiginitomaculum sp.]
MKAVKTVPEGMEYTIERFGKYTHTLTAGLSVTVPFIDRVGYKVDMRERKFNTEFSDLKTKDNAEIYSTADIYVSVTDSYKVAYATDNVDQTIRQKTELEMKKLVKSMTVKDITSQADTIDKALLAAINQHESTWGMQVRYIDVHKIYPV